MVYRNVQAQELLGTFLVTAVSSLLLLRFYLYLTGYPQVGNGTLHIAHMLWGGVLMLVALTVSLSFLGSRARWMTALIGGAGFGIFIDELGKFITRDNNYFFQPTIGIIYAVFVVLYLTFGFLSRRQKLTSREYQLNALTQLEEAVAHDMDPVEKARVAELLARADQADIVTHQLQKLLDNIHPVPPDKPDLVSHLVNSAEKGYQWFWRQRTSNALVRAIFIVVAGVYLFGIVYILYANVDNVLDIFHGHTSYSHFLVIGQLASTIIAASYAAYGAVLLPQSRLTAFEQFRNTTLVNLFLTEFFIFSRVQFQALPSFLFNLILLVMITYTLHQERHLHSKQW